MDNRTKGTLTYLLLLAILSLASSSASAGELNNWYTCKVSELVKGLTEVYKNNYGTINVRDFMHLKSPEKLKYGYFGDLSKLAFKNNSLKITSTNSYTKHIAFELILPNGFVNYNVYEHPEVVNTLAFRYNYDGDMNWFVTFDVCESSLFCKSIVNDFGVYRNDGDVVGGYNISITNDYGRPYKLKESYFQLHFNWGPQRKIYDDVGEDILNKLKNDFANAPFWQNTAQCPVIKK